MGMFGEAEMRENRRRRSLFFWMFTIIVVYSETEPFYVKAGVYGSGTGQGFNQLPDQVPGTIPPSPSITMSRFEPYFDTMIPRNVTALVGKSAYLSCRVRNLGNKTVSWIRHRDIHILTVGAYTYTSDQRFQANHHRQTDEWILQIKWAQKRDAGVYECQISTQPVRSYFVTLNVVEGLATAAGPLAPVADFPPHSTLPADILAQRPPPYRPPDREHFSTVKLLRQVPTAAILGEPDLHVDKGSTINLTCSIRFSPEPPAYIFWYHHDETIFSAKPVLNDTQVPTYSNGTLLWQVISYDSNRGGVSVITEKGDVTTSFLLIQHADIADSGKYSCSPSNADVASIRVHVLNGERPAAMQTGSACLANSSLNILFLIILTILYRSLYRHIDIHLVTYPR